MRYAKYPGGKKYADEGTERSPQQWADAETRAAAVIFGEAWQILTDDPAYQRLKERHRETVCDSDESPMAD